MSLFNRKKEITFSQLLLLFYIIIIITLAALYFLDIIESTKIQPLIGGGLVSAIAVFAQFIMQYKDFYNNEELKANGVVKFLERRDDKSYYEIIINETKEKLDLLFYTGKRFSEDFCQDFEGDNAIVKALEKGVNIRVLLINKSMLPEDEYSNFDIAEKNFKRLKSKYKGKFNLKYYNHIQTHNIFSNEKISIIGPYFHNKKSKYSNSIHFLKSSPYVKDFECFFESEWDLTKC
jgi:hypothetical protein